MDRYISPDPHFSNDWFKYAVLKERNKKKQQGMIFKKDEFNITEHEKYIEDFANPKKNAKVELDNMSELLYIEDDGGLLPHFFPKKATTFQMVQTNINQMMKVFINKERRINYWCEENEKLKEENRKLKAKIAKQEWEEVTGEKFYDCRTKNE